MCRELIVLSYLYAFEPDKVLFFLDGFAFLFFAKDLAGFLAVISSYFCIIKSTVSLAPLPIGTHVSERALSRPLLKEGSSIHLSISSFMLPTLSSLSSSPSSGRILNVQGVSSIHEAS